MTEADLLPLLRALPLHPGARALADDAAVLGDLVLTTDTLVEGIHFLADDPPADIGWKLVAVNLSDLAAKGAAPEGVLLNLPLAPEAWMRPFLGGVAEILTRYDAPLLGGDTVALPAGAPRVLACTAIGRAAVAPARGGGRAGDALWVTGVIGAAGLGLAAAKAGDGPPGPLAAYRRPLPRLAEGRALGPHVHAMADVSDGLLIDAARMAAASGLAATIELAAVPLSPHAPADLAGRLAAATAGDDYELLFAAPAGWTPPVPATRVGRLEQGAGLTLFHDGAPAPPPARLGFEHACIARGR